MKTTWMPVYLAVLALTASAPTPIWAQEQDPNPKSPELRLKDEKDAKVSITAKTAANDPQEKSGMPYKEFAIPVEPDKVYTLTREGLHVWQYLLDTNGKILQIGGHNGDRLPPLSWSHYFQVTAKTVVYARIHTGGQVVGAEFTVTLTSRPAPKPEAITLTDGKFARADNLNEADGLYMGSSVQKSYLLTAEKGQQFTAELVDQKRKSAILPLVVVDGAGKELAKSNGAQTKFVAPADGTYRVIVHSGGTGWGERGTRRAPFRHEYSLSIRRE